MTTMQQDPNAGPAGADELAGRRACDQCRMRKIRCDKDLPTCSNCRTAKRACTTGATSRKEPRQRVLISSQYERKIDQIESRLGSIESLLRSISSQSPGHVPTSGSSDQHQAHLTPHGTRSSSQPTVCSNAEYDDSSEDESAYGGDTGLSEQTVFASEFLERAVKKTSLRDVNPKWEASLETLRQLVEMQKTRSISHGPRFPLQQPIPPGGLAKLPMPPIDIVVSHLKQGKGAPATLFSVLCAIVGIAMSDFTDWCRQIYFATEEFSQATFCIVNAGLYNLFIEEQETAAEPELREQYGTYMRICRANLETGLANLPLFLLPKVENVQALLLGALYAIDVSRPSVAWHLISSAAQLCLTGGFHRSACLAADPPDLAQTKATVFWHIYSLDKGLGLRLGRSCVIQDCDITIPREFHFEQLAKSSGALLPGAGLATFWIRLSKIQSSVYIQLYSPAALAASPTDMAQRARRLADKCRKMEAESETFRNEAINALREQGSSGVLDMFYMGDEVQFHVTMTLIYRAIPAAPGSNSRFCDECLEYARKAMRVHETCMNQIKMGDFVMSIYIHWNLLLTPFSPFFILFCYVIETSSVDDLRTIQGFVQTLQTARRVSETVEKLYRLCQAICDVATLYVEAKAQQQQDETMIPIGDEFEMYLSQLGFMPSDDMSMANAAQGDMNMQVPNQTGQMADWFMLLEEDLTQIDNYPWMQSGPV